MARPSKRKINAKEQERDNNGRFAKKNRPLMIGEMTMIMVGMMIVGTMIVKKRLNWFGQTMHI